MPIYQDENGIVFAHAGTGDLVFRAMHGRETPERTAILIGQAKEPHKIGADVDPIEDVEGYAIVLLFENRESLAVFIDAANAAMAAMPPRGEALPVAAEPEPLSREQ